MNLLLCAWAVQNVFLPACDVGSDGSQTFWVFSGVPVTRNSSVKRSSPGWSETFPKSSRSVSNCSYIKWVVSRLSVLLVLVG